MADFMKHYPHQNHRYQSTRWLRAGAVVLVVMAYVPVCQSFVSPSRKSLPENNYPELRRSSRIQMAPAPRMELKEIKQQLADYLEKRLDVNADELAKQEKGKIIGGTKGNRVLNYISGAPTKEQVVDRIPNVFDYDELTKYGFSNLVTPIMELGGRRAIYDLMGMEAPPLLGPPPKLEVPDLVFDRTGEEDKARYSGLKMGQILDDNVMAEALAQAAAKARNGESLRPKLMEEAFEVPYADKRNTGPQMTPDWTPELLDEYTKQQGKANDWARRAKMGELVKDPDEILDLNLSMRLYLVLLVSETSFAFGRSTPTFFQNFLHLSAGDGSTPLFLEAMQTLGLVLTLASIGSAIFCGTVLAPPLNRDTFLWTIKGVLGGPLALNRLRNLDALITQGEQEEQNRAAMRREN